LSLAVPSRYHRPAQRNHPVTCVLTTNALLRSMYMVIALAFGAPCANAQGASPAALADLAPGGKLRAGVNYGNPVLVQKDPDTGGPKGLAVDLAQELGRRLGVPVELVTFDAAGKMADAAGTGAWDIAFLAVDPVRAAQIAFTAPYLEIEGVYLVPAGSTIRANDEVDREGVRIAVGKGSAYDLYLTRALRHAQLVRAPTSPAAVEMFVRERLEVSAGVKQQLEAAVPTIPGSRLLPGRFMAIGQAAGVPRGRDAGAAYVAAFIEDAKASGFVARSLARHGIEGATVAPPAPVR
jgi:polar amino acid transport system substrate-binding protein